MGYQVGNRLASGGMGEVYFALQTAVGGFEKLVLIKRIHSELEQDDELSQMFLNEARLIANLRHPNVVETFDIGRDEQGLFLVMGYLPGVSLRQAIVAKAGLPLSIVVRVAADIAAGLSAAHNHREGSLSMSIVHRDVTPANIQLCRTGGAKLLDFGVAQLRVANQDEHASRVRGTITYMSPEMLSDQRVSSQSDVFQLGVVMYEAITGHRPFAGRTETEIIESQKRAPTFTLWNPAFAALVRQCLDLDPSRRPSSNQLADQLAALCQQLQSATSRDMSKWVETEFASELAKHEKLEGQNFARLREVCDSVDKTSVLQPRDRPSSSFFGSLTAVGTSRQRKDKQPSTTDSPSSTVTSVGSGRWKYLAMIAFGAAVAVGFGFRSNRFHRPSEPVDNASSWQPAQDNYQHARRPLSPVATDVSHASVVAAADVTLEPYGDLDIPANPARQPRKTSLAPRPNHLTIVASAQPATDLPSASVQPAAAAESPIDTPTSPSDLRDPWLRK